MDGSSFLLIAHRAPVRGEFTLNDLAGGGGRMDEVARVVSTAFTISNGLRRDVELTILFVAEPPPAARKIVVRGDRVRYLNPDERSTAALLKNALQRSARSPEALEASPGITVGATNPLGDLERFARSPDTIWLRETGVALREFGVDRSRFDVVLSDDQDLRPEEEAVLRGAGVPEVSVGPRSLRASQCVDVLLNELDLRAAHSPGRSPADRR